MQKGGIVKSQSSSEIAHDLRSAGFRVLEIDMDWTTGLTERAFPDDLPYEIEREPLSNSFTLARRTHISFLPGYRGSTH
jgi:chromosome partitioning protein